MNAYDQPGDPVDGCAHKRTTHRHGTHAAYVLDKCRCPDCREATRAYEAWRVRQPPRLVPADRARAHLLSLIEQGMSEKQIRKVTGLGSNISRLVYPDSSPRPAKKIRPATEAKILATPLILSNVASVDPEEFHAIVAELRQRGWSNAAIARGILGRWAASLQIGRYGYVQAGKLRKARRLLYMPVPKAKHGPTGRMVSKDTGHRGQVEIGYTPGVPLDPELVELERADRLRADREALATRVAKPVEPTPEPRPATVKPKPPKVVKPKPAALTQPRPAKAKVPKPDADGMPPRDFPGHGILRCHRCGGKLVEHSLTRPCAA